MTITESSCDCRRRDLRESLFHAFLPGFCIKRNDGDQIRTLIPMTFSTLESTQNAFKVLIDDISLNIPNEAKCLVQRTTFTNVSSPIIPCPFRQLEAAAALKAVEAAVANAIGEKRFGFAQDVTIDLQHAMLFLFMAYIATVDGFGKQDNEVKKKLKGTRCTESR